MSALAATAEVLSPADATAATSSREIAIPAEDGTRWPPPCSSPPCSAPAPRSIVIAAGAGIARRYYARFATYLAERGHTVLTFDYRDIGGSRRGTLSKARPCACATGACSTCRACSTWAARTYPDRPLHWVGHSMGGFATGLAHNNT